MIGKSLDEYVEIYNRLIPKVIAGELTFDQVTEKLKKYRENVMKMRKNERKMLKLADRATKGPKFNLRQKRGNKTAV